MEKDSALHTQTLWQTACGLYEQPGIQAACLTLQNHHKANVLVILWLCWAEALKLPLTAEQLNQGTEAANGQTYEHIKNIRQLRKAPPEDLPENTKGRLKSQLLSAELTLEQQILERLERLSKGGTQKKLNTEASQGFDLPPRPLQNYLAQLQPPLEPELMAKALNWSSLLIRLP